MVLIPNPERRLGGMDFILRRTAEIHPKRVALDDRLNNVEMTFGELMARSTQLARALIAAGVQKGEPVAYAFFNEHASLECLFGCCMAGAVAVPLNNRLAVAESRDYLTRQECRYFIANTDLAGMADGVDLTLCVVRGKDGATLPQGAVDYEAFLAGQPASPMKPVVSWEDPYMMAMTGGTTGGPKAAVWGHGGCMMDTLSVMLHLGIRRGASTLCLAPTYHAAGLGWGVLPVLWQGGRVIMPPTPSFDPAFTWKALREEPDLRYLLIVPAMIRPLAAAWDGNPVESLSSMCIASAPTPEAQRRQLQEMFPAADLMVGYGMTETFSMCVQTPGEFLALPASAGEPSAVTRIRIVDDDGNPVERGEVGHIQGRTIAMSLYYNNDPENTAGTFRTMKDDAEDLEWMTTGDVGFMDEEGRVTLVDRAKDIIITGGENVASVEVETAILEHPGIAECAVIGLPDETWGERVVAVLVKKPESGSDDDVARAVVATCRKRLAGYKAPKQVAFLDALPRSPFGKVLKRDLVKMEFDRSLDGDALRG